MMLLKYEFDEPQLNLTLELFLRMVRDFFGELLVSVVLHGSVLWQDLAPGYGDLDFLVVVEGNVTPKACRELAQLREPLRTGQYGIIARMLEGAFLPRQMLNPANAGRAYWWGTSGERVWESNELGWLVLHVIPERGLVIWGDDIRPEIPIAQHEDLVAEVWGACDAMNEHGRGGGLHSIDWLFTAARLLLWLKEGRLSSKTEAADWAATGADGGWRELLPQAKQLRDNPSMADSADVERWLHTLTEPIGEAEAELECELLRKGFQRSAASNRGDCET